MRGWFGACGGCHCKATIRKWDAAGHREWGKRRGKVQGAGSNGTQADYCLACDFSNELIYTGGTLVDGQDEGAVYGYSDLDTAHLDWKSNRNGFTETTSPPLSTIVEAFGRRRIVCADGYVTRAAQGNPRIVRYDPSNGNVVAAVDTVSSQQIALLFPGPSGDVFVVANSIRRYNTSLTNTHSQTGAGFLDVCPHGSGFVAVGGNFQGTALYGATLGAASLSAVSNLGDRVVSDGTYAYVRAESNTKRLSFAGSIATDWTNSTASLTGDGYTGSNNQSLLALDASSNIYMVRDKAGTDVSKIQRRSPSDGSIVWEVDVGVSKAGNMVDLAVGGGIVVAIGRWYNGASSTDPRNIIALDADDGSFLWDDYHGNDITKGLYEVAVDDVGGVYACGYYG